MSILLHHLDTAAPVSLDVISSSCLPKYEFKDKFFRLVQYLARFLSGIAVEYPNLLLSKDASSFLFNYNKAKAIQAGFSDARRAFRFGKELPILTNIFNLNLLLKDPIGHLSKVNLLFFLLSDHLAFFVKNKLYTSTDKSAKDFVKLGMKFFTLSHFCNFLINFRLFLREKVKLENIKEEGDSSIKSGLEKNMKLCKFNMLRSLLCVIQGLHNSEVIVSSETICGGAGVLSSIMDLTALWPRRK